MVALALVLIVSVFAHSAITNYTNVSSPQKTEELKSLGLSLAGQVTDSHDRIIARLPHIAHYAGLTPFMFPTGIESPEELVSYCRSRNITFVAYTFAELQERPELRVLWDQLDPSPDLIRVAANRAGVVFRVKP